MCTPKFVHSDVCDSCFCRRTLQNTDVPSHTDSYVIVETIDRYIILFYFRFPSGMKALGDYIHNRGLKYGIYEDYGKHMHGYIDRN